jgi:V8-like Glu-specific endopeptidase
MPPGASSHRRAQDYYGQRLPPRPIAMLNRLCLVLTLAATAPLLAQSQPIPEIIVPVGIDSGSVQNTMTSPVTAGTEQVVWSGVVTAPGSPWIRLHYAGVMLSGHRDRGSDGSYLRITSLKDGHHQTQHSVHVGQWQDTSAYFNGDSVLVEILAHQGTGPNRIIIDRVWAGPPSLPSIDSICGATDDRQLSSDPRVCRLWPVGCTGWLIDDCQKCMLTAGHCTGTSMQVAQFNVPPSSSGGSAVAPPPADQYAIDNSSVQTNGGQGVGNDWGYYGVFPNSTTGLTPFQSQGSQAFTLLPPPAVTAGAQIRITGNGSTSSPVSPTWNLVQKTHVGSFTTSAGTTVQYVTDTTGGNSGSPVIYESTGDAIGIHTHGGCTSTGGQNSGTGANHTALQAALASPAGVCACPGATFSYPNGLPTNVNPDGSTVVRMAVASAGAAPTPNTGQLHVDTGSGFQVVPMNMVAPNLYEANMPAATCNVPVRFYFSVQTNTAGLQTDPRLAPTNTYSAVTAQSVTTVRNFDFNSAPPGWSVSNTAVTAGAWARGVPAGGGARRDPANDYDGSGSCWVTGLATNDDLDGGPTVLTTDIMDLSALSDPRISYARWMSNDDLDDFLVVEVSDNAGATWTQVENVGDTAGWVVAEWRVLAYVSNLAQVRVRWSVADNPNNSVTEAAIDAFRVYDIVCNQASWSSFGAPCLGTNGVAVLQSVSLPALGTNFHLRVLNTGGQLTIMMTGFDNTVYQGTPLPASLQAYGFPGGCQLLVAPAINEVIPNAGNTAEWVAALPNDPAFQGMPLYNQAVVLGTIPGVTQGGAGVVF